MQRMWSPWRSEYIETFKKPQRKRRGSLFTAAVKAGDDDEHLIVWRAEHCFVIMNRYPYNSGHVMVVPYRQVADIQGLTPNELAEIMTITQRSIRALDAVLGPHGYNFGANFGRVSGAGIENHIHFHIVPRWNGDTNFMPVLNEVKLISEFMDITYEKLKKAVEDLKL